MDSLDPQNEEDKDIDIVPAPNQENGETDNETGDENNLQEVCLNQVYEVARTVEIQTAKQLPRVKNRNQQNLINLMLEIKNNIITQKYLKLKM